MLSFRAASSFWWLFSSAKYPFVVSSIGLIGLYSGLLVWVLQDIQYIC